ncbi:UDP-N-acetylmuramoyl-tripeptide--D-alanyl-D-alanine ligase [Patescibacteria group bacterium]|nr:UDP-N-acetylmuramoyl-tripeptide--D-alanyl-D-alanine ligase [Patescibacteria group bacterium]
MKKILRFILKILAKLTLYRYRPVIIGITGSVGKTSVKQAVADLISTSGRTVWHSQKNLNNEIGLPLTVLLAKDSAYRNLGLWLVIFTKSLGRLIKKDLYYPEFLVLEYGVDHPGDMDYLLTIVRPQVAVLTAVSASHLEFMGSLAKILEEKSKLLKALPLDGTAIINGEDEKVLSLKTVLKSRVLTYGQAAGFDIYTESAAVTMKPSLGMSFKLALQGNNLPITVLGTVGSPVILTALAAAAVGQALGFTNLQILEGLEKLTLPAGRLRLLPGIKETILLDDTYNSSPRAAAAALQALVRLPLPKVGGRRWAVLGDMLELGSQSEKLHSEVGQTVANLAIDFLLTVGNESRVIGHGALAKGMDQDRIWHFANVQEAGLFIQDRLNQGDVVLIKGSQGVRCEKITKELMAEPLKAGELLVRQYGPWLNS